MRVRKVSRVRFGPELYNIFGFHHHPNKNFFWLSRGLNMSDGPRMGWYDSSRVRGGQDFQVDSKAEIKLDYKGDIRQYFNESKIV